MSNDTKWIIGTVVLLAGLLAAQIAGVSIRIDDLDASVNGRIDDLDASVNGRIDDLDASVNGRIDDLDTSVNGRIDDLRTDVRDFRAEVNTRLDAFDTRLRNVEIAFGKVDQRLLTIERVVLPASDQPGE